MCHRYGGTVDYIPRFDRYTTTSTTIIIISWGTPDGQVEKTASTTAEKQDDFTPPKVQIRVYERSNSSLLSSRPGLLHPDTSTNTVAVAPCREKLCPPKMLQASRLVQCDSTVET